MKKEKKTKKTKIEREREMFYLTTHSTHFIYKKTKKPATKKHTFKMY